MLGSEGESEVADNLFLSSCSLCKGSWSLARMRKMRRRRRRGVFDGFCLSHLGGGCQIHVLAQDKVRIFVFLQRAGVLVLLNRQNMSNGSLEWQLMEPTVVIGLEFSV